MPPPYDALTRLASLADRIRDRSKSDLPSFFAMTDPGRGLDPVSLAMRLPRGTGLIYRHFGAPDRYRVGHDICSIAQQRGVIVLVSNDADLAASCGADGLHWPEAHLSDAARMRARGDGRIFTCAAHSPSALHKASEAGIDAALYSCAFASASPSASPPKGSWRMAAAASQSRIQVYALGGINARTAKRLIGLGLSGIACVDALNSD
jgi:thiamine-phosphate pyrophosphorylase